MFLYIVTGFEDTNGVIRIRNTRDRHTNDQRNKNEQRCTKHYSLNERSSNTNPTKNRGCTQVQGFAVTAPLDIPFHSTKSKNIIQADKCFVSAVCFDSRLSTSRALWAIKPKTYLILCIKIMSNCRRYLSLWKFAFLFKDL